MYKNDKTLIRGNENNLKIEGETTIILITSISHTQKLLL